MIIFYREKYHNIISKVYSSKTFDIVWIRIVTKENPLFFCFFYAPGAHYPEDVRISFYENMSKSYTKIADKGRKYLLGDANARLGSLINDLNIHGIPIENKNKPLFMGFIEFCGITLLNKIYANGVPTYDIPNAKRSIIDMGMTNALITVSYFKVLSVNLGVTLKRVIKQ